MEMKISPNSWIKIFKYCNSFYITRMTIFVSQDLEFYKMLIDPSIKYVDAFFESFPLQENCKSHRKKLNVKN